MKAKNNAQKGNDHKKTTPSTTVDRGNIDSRKFTSYDVAQKETSTPQRVRQAVEPEGEEKRLKEANGEGV